MAHVYDDVVPALERWKAAGIDIRIYSSGSVAAQKLFFGHTKHGSLLDYFSGHYDTTTGAKKDAGSYEAIAIDFGLDPSEILFLSDAHSEIVAAKSAGYRVTKVDRGHGEISDFNPTISQFRPIRLTNAH